jgi:hypothetical protein
MSNMSAMHQWALAYISDQSVAQYKESRIRQINAEILWIENQMCDHKLTAKNIQEYKHQIRHKEIELAFLNS